MKKKLGCILSLLFVGLFGASLASCGSHEHAFTEQVIVKNPTCTGAGVGYFLCPEDQTRTQDLPIAPLGHVEAVKTIAPTCTEQGYDLHYCTRCGEELLRDNFVVAKGHVYEETIVPPTCTEQGYTIYECECGDDHYIGDYVDAFGHDYVPTIVPPTCTEKGYTRHECSRCGDTYFDAYVESLGHDITHHEGKEPTCDADGWAPYDECSRCDYSTYEPLPAFGHHYRKTVIAPTCSEEGHTHYECLTCGKEYDGDIVPALDHDYVYYPAKAATCDEAGHEEYYVCSRCGDTNYKEIPPIEGGHEYTEKVIEPTVSSRGYTLHTCTHCGATYKTDFVSPLPAPKVYSADEALSAGMIGENELVYSSRDDDFYYYAVYQGRVSNFIFHSLFDFTWSEAMAKLGTYPKEREVAKPMDVLENYQAFQSIWEGNVRETLLGAIPLSPKGTFQVLPSQDAKLTQKASDLLRSAGKGRLLETYDPSLATVSAAINDLSTSYLPGENFDLYEEGVRYSYVAKADLDLYVAVAYDVANETFHYRLGATLVDKVSELFVAMTKRGFDELGVANDVSSLASSKMGVPTNYTTNHPLITYDFNVEQNFSVYMEDSNGLDYILDGAEEAYDRGYDAIYIVFTFKMNCGGIFSSSGATFYVEIDNKDDGRVSETEQFSVTKGNPRYESHRVNALLSLFPGGLVRFRSRHKSGFAYDLTVTAKMYLYSNTAKALGAYAGTPVGDLNS